MNQSKTNKFKFSVFVDLANSIPFTLNSKPTLGGREFGETSVPRHWARNPVSTVEDNQNEKKLLYDLLAKLNTYDHIARIFVLNNPEAELNTRPADVPSDELYHNTDATKNQYYMFNQETGSYEFFAKVLNIDQTYKLNQAQTSDIIYITDQNNRNLINLRRIYASIPNPNVITIKIDTSSPSATNSNIQEVMDFLSLSRKPLSIRITKNALHSNMQAKVLSHVDKYRKPDNKRVAVVYPAVDKYQSHYADRSLFNMYLTEPAVDLDDRISSVTTAAVARFLARLLTGRADAHKPVKSRRGRLVSGIRRFTRKVLGRASSRGKQARNLDRELPSKQQRSSKKTSKRAKSIKQSVSATPAEVTKQLQVAVKYMAEVARLDTLIAESGKSRQDKQKTQEHRDRIININMKYRAHRIGFIRAIKGLFRSGTGTVKSHLYALYSKISDTKHKQVLERIIRLLDDRDFIANSMGNTANKANNYVDIRKVKRVYQDTLRENIAANLGFFKKLTRKRILSQLTSDK